MGLSLHQAFFKFSILLVVLMLTNSTISAYAASLKIEMATESEIKESHLWHKVWNGEDPANIICVRGVENLEDDEKSHFYVGSNKLSEKSYKLCSELEFYSHNTDGERTTVRKETLAPQVWSGVHWNSSAVSPSSLQASSQESHMVHLQNLSPVSLHFSGLEGQSIEAGATKKVKVQRKHFDGTELKTLDWLTHLMADYIVNKTSGFVDEEKVGSLKAALIVRDADSKGASELTSTASYSLLQPTSPTTVTFHMMEASYIPSPAKEEKRQRKLLQQSGGYRLASTFACPKGYCFRLPKWKISRTCKPRAPSYSACLYRCVCK